ncbi:MAG: GspE/PulE family protein, partial [Acidimicrobiales bacterium]
VLAAIERGASADSRVEELLAQVAEDVASAEVTESAVVTTAAAPLVRFVDLLLVRAVQERASDVHIEPSSSGLRIRFRVDGVLRDAMEPPGALQAGLLSRVKVMADLDIAERRRPQDGRTSVMVGGETVDIRVATVPTVHGESAVLRILRPERGVASLEAVDLLKPQLEMFERALERAWGMVLVTGPTGSGKTTTLYGALHRLNIPGRSIVTVEDPVEYRLDGLKQVQVNTKAGLTFARAMRSFLRLDPDIMLVGEMRDAETARTAVDSSLTGHLVLSTLHTNDAASAPVRMIEMGIEAYLISASTVLITAQRLVRRLCDQCRRPEAISASALEGLDLPSDLVRGGRFVMAVPVGCERCAGSGYRGRLAVHEVLEFTEEIGELVVGRAPTAEVRRSAVDAGMIPLRQAGLYQVAAGTTSLEELLRVS